jgi:hypothetical protein
MTPTTPEADAVEVQPEAWQYRFIGGPGGQASPWTTVIGSDIRLVLEKAKHRPDLYQVRGLYPLPTPPKEADRDLLP